ncbi:MAG: NUDIX domain-containing protein [Chloroflexota bacterium]|nr:NUDIX domain-containing protein [Chloroflexota bacterium]
MQPHHLVVNVEVAVVRDGRYLATIRASGESHGAGWLGFPGGKVDPDPGTQNMLEQTARREVVEEVGLALDDPVTYVESHTFAVGDDIVLDIVMLARSSLAIRTWPRQRKSPASNGCRTKRFATTSGPSRGPGNRCWSSNGSGGNSAGNGRAPRSPGSVPLSGLRSGSSRPGSRKATRPRPTHARNASGRTP